MARTHTMQVTVELLHPSAAREVHLDVEYKFSSGSSDYFSGSLGAWLPGDPAEVEIEHIYWPHTRPATPEERKRLGCARVDDQHDVLLMLPDDIYQAIEEEVAERHVDEPDCDDY